MSEDHIIAGGGGGGGGGASGISSGGGIPSALRDFLFDLYDSVRTSQIPTEQHTLYTVAFRELTAKVRKKQDVEIRSMNEIYNIISSYFFYNFFHTKM
jgi:hypothetical protein